MNNRRKHKRYRASRSAFAAERSSTIRGQLIDISEGGLSFSYVDSGDRPRDFFELVIYLSCGGPNMPKLKCRTVSDTSIPKQNSFSFIFMRRCGVEFCGLADSQLSWLKRFVMNRIEC